MAEIQNPNQQGPGGAPGSGGNSSSLLMYFALFLLVFFGLQYYRQKTAPPPQAQHTAATAQSAPVSSTPAPAMAAADASAVQATAATNTVIDTPVYRVTFSNRGAQVISWVLKDKQYKNEPQTKQLDLVNSDASKEHGYPLSLYTYDAGLNSQLANALYVPSSTDTTLTAPATISFHYAANGLDVVKSFSFDASYVLRAHVQVTKNGAPVAAGLAWPSGFGDQNTLPNYANSVFDYSRDGKTEQVAYKKVSGGDTLRGNFDWAGVSDLYFAAMFLPEHPESSNVITLHNTVPIPRNIKKPNDGTEPAPVLGLALANPNGALDARIFVGPKALGVLSAIHGAHGGPTLEKIVSFGIWSIISKPLFLGLHWLHNHVVANWGWAILILTILLNLLMFPTRFAMMRQSLKMMRIQPKMDVIKAKYAKYKATDPRRQDMQKEIFQLQKDEGVNMFGGCLPMLLQWPLLYAFFRMLSNVVELRQAHWLWLPDLSAPDPLHILPVFFIVSMFLVQFLTPSPGVDRQQQRMMAFTMPAVFGFMTWSIASGLALYWAAGNILGIVQQLVINKTAMGREMRAIAAKRAAKQSGKTINARVMNARK